MHLVTTLMNTTSIKLYSIAIQQLCSSTTYVQLHVAYYGSTGLAKDLTDLSDVELVSCDDTFALPR